MGELQEKMLRRMTLKGYSQRTRTIYMHNMKKYVRYYGKSPEKLCKNNIEEYLHYMLSQKVSRSALVQAYSALKFFYSECLERPWELDKIPRIKLNKRLPVVLSRKEVKYIFDKVTRIRQKTILMLLYSTGLRLSEGLNLRIKDIDSSRMEIRVNQGKGKKDRYTLLSKKMLNQLRGYYKEYKPIYFLFPGKNNKPISSSTVQKSFNRAKKKQGLKRMQQYIHYDTVLQPIYWRMGVIY